LLLDLLISLFIPLSACAARPLALSAPDIAPGRAREPARVELEPFAAGGATIVGAFAAPGPAAVLAAAMKAELQGRALHTGARPESYVVRCVLDRFAVRSQQSVVESEEMLVLYADLSCEAVRATDQAIAWRGELRARVAAEAPNVLGSDASTTQRLLDRAMSDATREMASDLALRALALVGDPSARVFGDEAQQRAGAGLDDTPFGPAALQESPKGAEGALRALTDHDVTTRAAAWNVVALATGPGDVWLAGSAMKLDEDPLVRFVQYKALARLGSASALDQLRRVAASEGYGLLSEFVQDAIASGGIGLARSRASP
jgi:hypothetical protein